MEASFYQCKKLDDWNERCESIIGALAFLSKLWSRWNHSEYFIFKAHPYSSSKIGCTWEARGNYGLKIRLYSFLSYRSSKLTYRTSFYARRPKLVYPGRFKKIVQTIFAPWHSHNSRLTTPNDRLYVEGFICSFDVAIGHRKFCKAWRKWQVMEFVKRDRESRHWPWP